MSLGRQFRKTSYRTGRGTVYTRPTPGSTVETTFFEGPTDVDTYSYGDDEGTHAELEVAHRGSTGYTKPPRNNYPRADGQLELFSHRSSKPESKVLSMGGTYGARVAAMPLVGLAVNDAATRGNTLHPSNNLSPHSERMVGHLAERGVVDMPENISHNASTYWSDTKLPSPNSETLSPETVDSGRSVVRDAVRRPRPSTATQMGMF